MKFSAEELEIRRPIWIALSELYLDTGPDWERIAESCARSPFATPEIRRILFDEVHPVVHLNLWSTAGVWDGFDQDWLITSILVRKCAPVFRLPWPEERRYPWRELKPYLVSARERRAQAS